MNLDSGDTVLITFPFSDLSSVKVRPAVVLSSKRYNSNGEDIIVSLVTSNIARRGLFLVRVDSSHPQFISTGFKASSAIIVDKIHTLHSSLIKRRLGCVGSTVLTDIRQLLRDILF